MVDGFLLRIAKLEKEKEDLKNEIKKLEDIIVFLKKNYENIGIKIKEEQQHYHDQLIMQTHYRKLITIPQATLAVPISEKEWRDKFEY
jgi:DNA gyrase/topoisomerase IV subunit A